MMADMSYETHVNLISCISALRAGPLTLDNRILNDKLPFPLVEKTRTANGEEYVSIQHFMYLYMKTEFS
jgi:hypothetical protein